MTLECSAQKALIAALCRRMPRFMHPDLSRVENILDFEFQVGHEVDLMEEGELVRVPKRSLHRAKMFASSVHIAVQAFVNEYPEVFDDLNHATD